MKKHIYIIRHCKAAGQEAGAPLTTEGQMQADQLSDFLTKRPMDYIVSSPYERAVSSIRPFAQKQNLIIHTDSRLSERVLSSEQLDDWIEKLRESFDNMNRKYRILARSHDARNFCH
ncbi:histidine phosphatase family protein [Paenibacillus ihumii]|uniref:histidine phosphatase family protein n=1 Tax=Paenibacillus ihumii TaxID=687436 RepID=UPI000AE25C36|nr:histidine phosphatase family protein [Paenibacillus ihumii]